MGKPPMRNGAWRRNSAPEGGMGCI
jgi:hypothetical protein